MFTLVLTDEDAHELAGELESIGGFLASTLGPEDLDLDKFLSEALNEAPIATLAHRAPTSAALLSMLYDQYGWPSAVDQAKFNELLTKAKANREIDKLEDQFEEDD